MRIRVAVAASALLLGLAGSVQAGQLLSGGLPTSVSTSGACYVRNTGTTPVTVAVNLFSNNGIVAAQYHDFCSGVLAGGRTCVVLVDDLPDDSYAACRVTASNVSKLRGTIEVRQLTPTFRVLAAEELR